MSRVSTHHGAEWNEDGGGSDCWLLVMIVDGHDAAGQGTVCIFPSSTHPMPAPGTRHQAAKCGVSGPRLGLSCD